MDFGGTTVIRDLSFDVHAGETFGFLGGPGPPGRDSFTVMCGLQAAAALAIVKGQCRDAARL